jgi:hypothetical protein
LNAIPRRAGTEIEDLEIVMAIHPDIVAAVTSQEKHINWEGLVEGPQVNPFGVDLRFDEPELVLAGSPGRDPDGTVSERCSANM